MYCISIFWGGVASQGEVTSRGRCLFECFGFLDESLVNKGERVQLLCISCQQGGFFQGGTLLIWFSFAFVRDLPFSGLVWAFSCSCSPVCWAFCLCLEEPVDLPLHDCVECYLFLEESCFSDRLCWAVSLVLGGRPFVFFTCLVQMTFSGFCLAFGSMCVVWFKLLCFPSSIFLLCVLCFVFVFPPLVSGYWWKLATEELLLLEEMRTRLATEELQLKVLTTHSSRGRLRSHGEYRGPHGS